MSDTPLQFTKRELQTALSRDNLWITRDEHAALARGLLPAALMRRIARFHLVDNTRGEPPMWQDDEVRDVAVTLRDGRLQGRVQLATGDGDRRFAAQLLGFVRTEGDRVVGLELVATGRCRGEGPYTQGAPPGDFPLAISFTLADGTDTADAIPPQGSRGWLDGYLR